MGSGFGRVTNDTESFVSEVDESLRQERMLDIAKRYGPYLIGAFVAVLVAVAGWQFWQSHNTGAARRHAAEYAAAQEMARGGNLDAAKTEFERLTEEGPGVYRTMAQMELAAILAAQGDLDGAIAGFDEAAERASDPVMKQTAQLRAAYIAADTQDFAALQQRLTPLIESDTRISFLARELLGIEAWEAGQTDLARSTLETLSLAFDAPEEVRNRAQVALAVIGPAPAAASADGAAAPAPSEGEN
jgi:hypothetical protein